MARHPMCYDAALEQRIDALTQAIERMCVDFGNLINLLAPGPGEYDHREATVITAVGLLESVDAKAREVIR